MKLFDTVLFSLSAALLIIGVHQSLLHGIQNSYFLFMTASGFFLWYTLRKKNRNEASKKPLSNSGKGSSKNTSSTKSSRRKSK